MSKDALFIVIEGLDGSGKSSASKGLMERLDKRYPNKIKRSYEPHNPSCSGEFIRDILEKRITQFDPFILALAYAANRLDHNARLINPWLNQGDQNILICDRYYLSSLVYNSTEDFSYDQVMLLNKNAQKPDIIFFLNVSADVCRERMNKRNEPLELFETKLDTYRNRYLSAIKYLQQERGERVVEINGNQPLVGVIDDLEQNVYKFFPNWQPATNN